MKPFKKTASTENVSIMDYEGTVDWSVDAVNMAMIEAAEKEKQLSTSSAEERIADLKRIYHEAINTILGDPEACGQIFATDNSLEVVSEVFEYLTEGYAAYRRRRMSAYSPNRIANEQPAG